MTARELIQKLEAANGLEILHSTTGEWLRPADLIAYAADPDGFIAARYGVTVAQWREYAQLAELGGDIYLRCHANTRRGSRCKCYARPREYVGNPAKYFAAEQRGGYCHLHGGAT